MGENFHLRTPIAIGLGAIAGALCRYYIGVGLAQVIDINFPVGTLVINVTGCFLMGVITTFAAQKFTLSPDLMLLLTTGFLGAYTTFSSYELDTAELLGNDVLMDELLYWVGSPLLGLLFFYLGVWLMRSRFPSNEADG
jgi:CrcB protein